MRVVNDVMKKIKFCFGDGVAAALNCHRSYSECDIVRLTGKM